MAYHSQALSLNGLAAEINLLDPDLPVSVAVTDLDGLGALTGPPPETTLLDPALPVSVAVTDLDGFGPLNAAHGTEAGDAVLGSFERSLAAGLPRGALIAHSRGADV